VIDEMTLGISMVTAGQTPHFVTVDTAANQIYVLNGGTSIFSSPPGSTVTVIDGATNATTTLVVGELPTAAAVNPVTHRVYVTNACGDDSTCSLAGLLTGTVSVIEAAH